MKTSTAIVAFVMTLTMASAATATEVASSPTTAADLDALGRVIARDKCARPKKVVVKQVPNRYENVTDEIKTYFCSGYRVVVYEAHASNVVRELPMEVTLTRSIPGLPPNLSIGRKVGDVRAMLGTPYSESETELVYSLSDERPGEDTITFRLKAGRIDGVIWSWNVD